MRIKWKKELLSASVLLLVLLIGGAFTACTAPAPEPDQVTVQLSWFHTAEFAGFYAAEQQGYYAEENLSVDLVAGRFDVLPWEEVAEGSADFGITGGGRPC